MTFLKLYNDECQNHLQWRHEHHEKREKQSIFSNVAAHILLCSSILVDTTSPLLYTMPSSSLTQKLLEVEMQIKCFRDHIGDMEKDEAFVKDTSEFVESAQKQIIVIAGKSLHRLGASKPK